MIPSLHAHFTTRIIILAFLPWTYDLPLWSQSPYTTMYAAVITQLFIRHYNLLVPGLPLSNVQMHFRNHCTIKAHVQLWLPLKILTRRLYLFLSKSVVRELISRYWARRRREKNPSENGNPDQMAAIRTVKDEVADMLSEIRNILKTNKRSRSRERILRSDEVVLEVNDSPWNYQVALLCLILSF